MTIQNIDKVSVQNFLDGPKIDLVGPDNMPKLWAVSFLDNLDGSLIVFQDQQLDIPSKERLKKCDKRERLLEQGFSKANDL